MRVSVLDVSHKVIALVTSEPGENRDGSPRNHDYAGHGHSAHELSSERLINDLEFLFALDVGCQHLFRQGVKDAWYECIICMGIIIRERTAIHCEIRNAISGAANRKGSPLR